MAALVQDRITIGEMVDAQPVSVWVHEGERGVYLILETHETEQIWLDKPGAQLLADNLSHLIEKM